jgi:hypothetical protein
LLQGDDSLRLFLESEQFGVEVCVFVCVLCGMGVTSGPTHEYHIHTRRLKTAPRPLMHQLPAYLMQHHPRAHPRC